MIFLRVIRISGESLSPEFNHGDFVVISKIPMIFNWFHVGDKVVFYHNSYGRMIKIVSEIDDKKHEYTVTGLHPNSIDSRDFGTIKKDDIIGKVIWHIKKES